jgi:hypothetical protein
MNTTPIEVGEIVYNNRQGESGVSLRVLELRDLEWHGKVIPQALCRGALGWGKQAEWYAVSNLTHTPNLRGRWPDEEGK